MSEREERKKRLREASKQSMKKAEALLDDELKALKNATGVDLEALRPKISDNTSFEQLLAAVTESTSKNENIAQLKERLEKLGQGCVTVSREVIKLLTV